MVEGVYVSIVGFNIWPLPGRIGPRTLSSYMIRYINYPYPLRQGHLTKKSYSATLIGPEVGY